jgi:hypothetical protein
MELVVPSLGDCVLLSVHDILLPINLFEIGLVVEENDDLFLLFVEAGGARLYLTHHVLCTYFKISDDLCDETLTHP